MEKDFSTDDVRCAQLCFCPLKRAQDQILLRQIRTFGRAHLLSLLGDRKKLPSKENFLDMRTCWPIGNIFLHSL